MSLGFLSTTKRHLAMQTESIAGIWSSRTECTAHVRCKRKLQSRGQFADGSTVCKTCAAWLGDLFVPRADWIIAAWAANPQTEYALVVDGGIDEAQEVGE